MTTIDLDHAYRPRRGLTVVPVADEAAVYDRRTNRLHRLDPIATVVWGAMDGRVTVRELCGELAEAYGAPVAQVSQDVVRLLEDLTEQGLVEASDDSTDEETDDEDAEPPPMPGEIRVLRVAPTRCVDTVTALGWLTTDALLVEGFVVGIRSSDEASRAVTHGELANAEWIEGLDVDANVSLRPPLETDDGIELGQVYAECTLVGRSRDLDVLLDRVRREIAGRIIQAQRDTVSCHVTVLQSLDGVVLAPAKWWPKLVGHDRALADAGWTLLSRHVVLDGSADERGIGLPSLTADGDALTFEACGPVTRVLGPFQADPSSPAERMAAVAVVVSPGASEDSASDVLAACTRLSEGVDLVSTKDAGALLKVLRG